MSEKAKFARGISGVALGAFLLWVAAAAAYLMWRAFTYGGLIGRLGEWQFAKLNFYFPAFTLAALVVLCALPLALAMLVLGLMLFRRGRRQAGRVLTSAGNLVTLFLVLGVGGIVGALASLVLMLQHPGSGGPVQEVRLNTPSAREPREGPTKLYGTIDYARTARLKDDVLFFSREMYIAPIIPASGDTGELRYFVEVPSTGPTARQVASIARGILSRQAVPAEIAQLYRNSGSAVSADNYILFGSDQSLRWRPLTVAAQFAVFALISLLFALFQNRHRKQLKTELGGDGLEIE